MESDILEFFNWIWNIIEMLFLRHDNWRMLLVAFGNTLLIAFVSVLIGIVIGVIVAIGKVASARNKKLFLIRWVCDLYITVIRGTPVYVQLLLFYFAILPMILGSNSSDFLAGVVTFGLNSGAYVAEIVRAGIQSVDIGQTEAGRSLGLSSFQTMKSIVLPQAIKTILPALGNEFIVLIKETSIIGITSIYDLTKWAERISSFTYDLFIPLLFVSLIYLALVLGLTKLLRIFERRLAKSDRR